MVLGGCLELQDHRRVRDEDVCEVLADHGTLAIDDNRLLLLGAKPCLRSSYTSAFS